jgi:hypothetical protein
LIALGLKIGDEPGDVLEAVGNNFKLQKPLGIAGTVVGLARRTTTKPRAA